MNAPNKIRTSLSSRPESNTNKKNNGIEEIWSSARAKVPGSSGASNLGSDMINRRCEERRSMVKHVEPRNPSLVGWKPSRKCKFSSSQQSEAESRFLGKKCFPKLERSLSALTWPRGKAPGSFNPNSGMKNHETLHHKVGKRYLDTYKNRQDSKGVKESFDPNLPLPPFVRGKRSLPTYNNEQLSLGVTAALDRREC